MRDITYREILENIECGLVIFLEDDFVYPQSVEMDEILCRMIRMDTGLHAKMVDMLSGINSRFGEAIKRFSDACKPAVAEITDWSTIADIRDVIEEYKQRNPEKGRELTTLCDSVSACYSDDCLPLLFQFGLHFNMVPKYRPVFDEYIEYESQFKPFLIFDNYNSDISTTIERYISDLSASSKTVTCIIDNNIKGTNRACDIIDKLQELSARKNQYIIGAVVTSNEAITRINDNVFIDYVSKDDIAKLKQALLRSSYHLFLHSIKNQLIAEIETAISHASQHRNIAIYLAEMARLEGTSNYEVLNQWIKAICETGANRKDDIVKMVAIANMLDACDESPEFEAMGDVPDINSHEAFDYDINSYYQPIAPGDIFETTNGDIYILVGQSCDMMMSESRGRRNGICELVKAQKTDLKWNQKTIDNLKDIWINNFRIDNAITAIKIDYQHRYFLDNEVISLCSYWHDGRCQVELNGSLDEKCIRLIQPYQITYYSDLQQYFNAVYKICNSVAKDEYALISEDKYVSRIFKKSEFSVEEGTLSFGFKRIARLKQHYYLYLYKLYLEHKGRTPFDTINLTRMQKIDVCFTNGKNDINLTIDAFLAPDIKSVKQLPWIIGPSQINQILSSISANTEIINPEDQYLLSDTDLSIRLADNSSIVFSKKSASKVCFQIKKR